MVRYGGNEEHEPEAAGHRGRDERGGPVMGESGANSRAVNRVLCVYPEGLRASRALSGTGVVGPGTGGLP